MLRGYFIIQTMNANHFNNKYYGKQSRRNNSNDTGSE